MEDFDASLRLDLSLLRGLRRELASWLEVTGVPDDASEAVVLATHEAAANAVEHADLGSEVTVRGVRDEEKLIVVVINAGTWAQPRFGDDSRGRGLPLIANLMSHVDVQVRSRRTTVRMRKDLSGGPRVQGRNGSVSGVPARERSTTRTEASRHVGSLVSWCALKAGSGQRV